MVGRRGRRIGLPQSAETRGRVFCQTTADSVIHGGRPDPTRVRNFQRGDAGKVAEEWQRTRWIKPRAHNPLWYVVNKN